MKTIYRFVSPIKGQNVQATLVAKLGERERNAVTVRVTIHFDRSCSSQSHGEIAQMTPHGFVPVLHLHWMEIPVVAEWNAAPPMEQGKMERSRLLEDKINLSLDTLADLGFKIVV